MSVRTGEAANVRDSAAVRKPASAGRERANATDDRGDAEGGGRYEPGANGREDRVPRGLTEPGRQEQVVALGSKPPRPVTCDAILQH